MWTAYASAMRWRRVAHRLPLTGVAVAGAVVGHMVAYVLAVPEPTVRVALLGATGHAYWTAAIAAALVLGLASLAATLGGGGSGPGCWPAAPSPASRWAALPPSWPGSRSPSTWSRRRWSGSRPGSRPRPC